MFLRWSNWWGCVACKRSVLEYEQQTSDSIASIRTNKSRINNCRGLFFIYFINIKFFLFQPGCIVYFSFCSSNEQQASLTWIDQWIARAWIQELAVRHSPIPGILCNIEVLISIVEKKTLNSKANLNAWKCYYRWIRLRSKTECNHIGQFVEQLILDTRERRPTTIGQSKSHQETKTIKTMNIDLILSFTKNA